MINKAVKQNTSYITLLSVVSAIAVVILHTNDCYWQFSTARYWITANLINAVFVFAVPVFFMISGATLLDYPMRYSTREFFRKRFIKAVVPFVAWSIICLLLDMFYFRSISPDDLSVKFILNGFANNSFNSVYWFFWPLFGVYACIPLFAAVPKDKRRSLFSYLAVICFVINALIPFVIRVFSLGLTMPLSVRVGSGYLLYILIGYLLNTYETKLWQRIAIYIAGMIGLFLYSYGTQVLSFEAGRIVDTLKGATNVTSICYATGVFLLFRQIGNRLMDIRWLHKLVYILKDYSFCIYLLHMPLLRAITKTFSFDTRSIIWRLGGVVVVVPICMAITYILRKIPIMRKIVP